MNKFLTTTTKILVIGKSGRNDCIVDSLARSKRPKQIFVFSDVANEGLRSKAIVRKGQSDDVRQVADYAAEIQPDFAVIGPEEPLASGVVDRLEKMGIPCVGPREKLARLESSKAFTRKLLSDHKIPGNPEHRIFRSMDGIEKYLNILETFVIKPDGLTSGKGVQVFGEHLKTKEQALSYCRELFASKQSAVIVEEKLDGEEFSFQSFCDGDHVVHTFPVQDHKRAYEGDKGPNTGGMGSYSCEDFLLPFLSAELVREACNINELVCKALKTISDEEGSNLPYKGILYGGFMVTKKGLRVIEYNARFGDPEVMNVLPLLETDFIDICEAIINGTLDKLHIRYKRKATVCKYVVPEGYPSQPAKGVLIYDIPKSTNNLRVFYAAIDDESGANTLTGSRALAVVGIADTLPEAERIAEDAACSVRGKIFHRRDIGTAKLVQKRIDHMSAVFSSVDELAHASEHA